MKPLARLCLASVALAPALLAQTTPAPTTTSPHAGGTVGFVAPNEEAFIPEEPFDATTLSLRKVPVPRPFSLADYIADPAAVLVLGKALFWDMQVGSDGRMACASCHFHAGADNRSRAQLNPGLLVTDGTGKPASDRTFQVGTPVHQLTAGDFPFRKLANPDARTSAVLRDSNDVSGSQGVYSARLTGMQVVGASVNETKENLIDAIFHHGGSKTRRVTPRNSPSVINAVFNFRNFWDGRAQNVFNGVNNWGLRDEKAMVWYAPTTTSISKRKIYLENSSLASQAVGPVLSSFEMASAGREFIHAAKHLLLQRPLAKQQVHSEDSVLGLYRAPTTGLTIPTYGDLIRQAFKKEWWQANLQLTLDPNETEEMRIRRRWVAANNGLLDLDNENSRRLLTVSTETFTQMQANFALFFGLALQAYQSTLVSNDAPIDRYAEGDLTALTDAQKRGLEVFSNKGRCYECHVGAAFTSAAPAAVLEAGGAPKRVVKGAIELMHISPGVNFVYDAGYYNIGVRPNREDRGIGAPDPFGNALAESHLMKLGTFRKAQLTGYDEYFFVFPNDRFVAEGFFKTPGLRNVELTAPYFHNGGTLTLEQVVEFYNRGGDFNDVGHHEEVRPLGLTAQEKSDLVAFMKSLTDERVRYKRAPFDHPQLFITNGPANVATGSDNPADQLIEIPAVGAAGGTPTRNFLD